MPSPNPIAALSIKRPEADRAVRERLLRQPGKSRAIRERCAQYPVLDHRSADQILGYDEHGLPR